MRQMRFMNLMRFVSVILLSVLFIVCVVSCRPAGIAGGGYAASDTDYDEILFEKKRTLTLLMDLPYPLSSYDQQSIEAYKNIIGEVSAALPSLNAIDEADDYILRLQEVLGSMRLTSGELPQVYIKVTGDIGDGYKEASVMIVDTQGREHTRNTPVTIKLRGNSTRGAPKKPYTIKFETGLSILGMEKSKKWVLLANAFDKTMLRNKMALDFAQRLNFPYSPEGVFAEVYLNGKYRGLYLLTEAVNEGKNRVNINVEAGDFLFEHETTRQEAGKTYITTKRDMRFKIVEPKTPTAMQISSVRDYLLEIERAMESRDYDKISRYIDVPSFVDFYVLMELFKDVDGWFSSMYFYLKDGVMYAGPVWDMDLSSGNVSDKVDEDKYRAYCNLPGFGTGSRDSADGIWMRFGWLDILMSCERFYSMVRERYLELQPYIVNLYEDNRLGQNQIDKLVAENRAAIERNNEMWPMDVAYSIYEMKPLPTYEENVMHYRDWLRRRNDFLLSYFG